MDIFSILFHPFFYIPFFLALGLIAILGPMFIKSSRVKKILAWAVVGGIVIYMIPYLYAVIMWIIVNMGPN